MTRAFVKTTTTATTTTTLALGLCAIAGFYTFKGPNFDAQLPGFSLKAGAQKPEFFNKELKKKKVGLLKWFSQPGNSLNAGALERGLTVVINVVQVSMLL